MLLRLYYRSKEFGSGSGIMRGILRSLRIFIDRARPGSLIKATGSANEYLRTILGNKKNCIMRQFKVQVTKDIVLDLI